MFEISDLLFYGGLAAAGCAALLGVLAAAAFRISRVRLQKQLEREYGKKRR